MRRFLYVLAGLVILSGALHAQQSSEQHKFMENAVINANGATSTVTAYSGEPLYLAISAVREEYGWVVDYEDPPYQSTYDLVDRATPGWHALHPGKPFLVPAGGAFQSTYPVASDIWSSSASEREVLEKIVSDYNQSGNPGAFSVRQQSDGSFAVVGISIKDINGNKQPVGAILDTLVTVPTAQRSLMETLKLIAQALWLKSGIKVVGICPDNNFAGQSAVSIGGTSVSVRSLLLQTAEQLPLGTVWNLLYEANTPKYILTFAVAGRAEYDTFGGKRLIAIRPPSAAKGHQ